MEQLLLLFAASYCSTFGEHRRLFNKSFVILQLFSQQLFSPSNNILILEALRDGNLVASNLVALADFEVVGTGSLLRTTLAVSNTEFDELRLAESHPRLTIKSFVTQTAKTFDLSCFQSKALLSLFGKNISKKIAYGQV